MLNHKGTKELKSERIRLRKFYNEDYECIYNNWTKDKEIFRYMTWGPHKNVEETKSMVDYWVFMSNNDNYYNWAITLDEDEGNCIGGIGISDINEEKCSGEIGYCLSKEYWNQGIATESLKMCLDYLFKEVNFMQISGICDLRNKASLEVMKKCGMESKEILRDYKLLSDGTLCDVEKLVIYRKDIEID